MTEITDLSPTDALNTVITGQSLEGNIANMANMDTTLQAILGMLARDVARRSGPLNLGLAASVASSALTISLKGADGNDPSATNPVTVPFRDVTDATGTPSVLTVTAATSLVISSGSTLGFTNGIPGRIWIVAFNDGGTLRLGAVNCLSGTTNIFPLYEDAVASSTAEGGAGGADGAHAFYTATAVTSKAYTILGYFEWASGLATAGTWGIVPTRISLFGPGHKKPGDVVQVAETVTGAASSGSTVIPFDDTIPTDTEGNEFMSVSIAPRSAANVLRASAAAHIASSAGPQNLIATICRDTSVSALAVVIIAVTGASFVQRLACEHTDLAGSVNTSAFKLRAGGSVAGTTTFNGQLGARQLGGALNSFMRIEEIMA